MPHRPGRLEVNEDIGQGVLADVRAGSEAGDTRNETDGDEDGNIEDDLARWQQRILERPHEGLRSLEIMFASSGYDSLVVLCLSHNAIDDISPIVCAAKTLRLLNLNANTIARLPGSSAGFWSRFHALTLAFLSGNNLSTWAALEGLVQCPKLLWLTVDGNPIMSHVNAREFIINKMPFSLKALNDHVITDVEYIRHAGRSIRFGAQNVRLFIGDTLSIPPDFDENESTAAQYIRTTELAIHRRYAANSPALIAQRVVRGYLSRLHLLPRFTHIRCLIVKVQSTVRGYLFRRAIRCEFVELVTQQGHQDLLFGPMDDALFMTGGAHRGLKKLVGLVQQWRVRFRLKKQAIAIKKIRFWCQMVYQRYRYRSQQLLHDQQEIFIYYTAPFEEELVEMALKTVHRDPVLMSLSQPERESLIRQRCVHSGVSVLRIPSQARVVTASQPSTPHSTERPPLPSTPQRIQRENAQVIALKKTLTPPLVRIFHKDLSLETQVLVTEKHLLQADLALIQELKRKVPPTGDTRLTPLQRAVAVHSSQLRHELERRLVNVNRRILTACIKQQEHKNRPRLVYSLTNVCIKVRGNNPTRSERRKITRLLTTAISIRAQGARAAMIHNHFLTDYAKMRVFIPWSIDMYMQITASLDRVLLLTNVSASFALTYEQTRQIHAAVAIQSAWRAGRHRCKRDALEATIARAVLCLQRWWRFCMGLRRRMAFLRACLLECGAINTPTLFMEAPVYHLLSDTARWNVTRLAIRPCREQSLHCLLVDSNVEISLSPAQMLLYASSLSPLSFGDNAQQVSKMEAVSFQRCGAYLPAWMLPGVPEHFEESMVSRDSDATAHLLVDHVHVEPTVIERELLLLGNSGGSLGALDAKNPFGRFAVCRQVSQVGSRVLELARKFSVEQRKIVPPTMDTATVTSFVRLTFDSVEEARHRALVLLAKTFDPITHSHARLFSIEALVGATMLRHQWAVAQAIGDANEGETFLQDCRAWLCADIPSKWLRTVRHRLPPELILSVSAEDTRRLPISPLQATRQSISMGPHRPAPPPINADLALAVPVGGPAPIHLAEAMVETGVEPVTPTPPHPRPANSITSSGSFSRHKMLTDRLGKPAYSTLDEARKSHQVQRDFAVRDQREERERAVEARIVDKRMLQRENAAELAGIHLEMHVKLQKIKYQQELAKLQTREFVEREKMNEHKRKLTRRFETTFIAQTGAIMRNAARRAVETNRVKKEAMRQARTVEIREREEEALSRRQDAKSYCFVSNQRAKESVEDCTEVGQAAFEAKEEKREKLLRKRIQEDKEIKKMLRLM